MQLPLENWAEREVSAYETERGKPMPSFNHSYVQSNLVVELSVHYRKQYTIMPELSLEMPEKPNCVPDICIFNKMSPNFLHDRITVAEMPITVIEIVSPTQSTDEILANFERYFFAGVQSCWLVMPSFQAVSVYSSIFKFQFFSSDMILTDPLTNIGLLLADVFA